MLDRAEAVGHDQAGRLDLGEALADPVLGHVIIQGAGGLVDQEDVGPRGDRPGDHESLPLPAREVAGYRRIEAEFARTCVRSPINGVVISRAVNPGETVNLGTPLLRIVDLTRLRIEAEVDAFDIPRCEPGCPVTITAQGYTGQSWQGTVEEIADSLIPRRIRPEDPGRPTDTRVLPVRIAFQQPVPLKLGQRVEVKIVEATSPKDGEPREQSAVHGRSHRNASEWGPNYEHMANVSIESPHDLWACPPLVSGCSWRSFLHQAFEPRRRGPASSGFAVDAGAEPVTALPTRRGSTCYEKLRFTVPTEVLRA